MATRNEKRFREWCSGHEERQQERDRQFEEEYPEIVVLQQALREEAAEKRRVTEERRSTNVCWHDNCPLPRDGHDHICQVESCRQRTTSCSDFCWSHVCKRCRGETFKSYNYCEVHLCEFVNHNGYRCRFNSEKGTDGVHCAQHIKQFKKGGCGKKKQCHCDNCTKRLVKNAAKA